jgi:hypothetical protein
MRILPTIALLALLAACEKKPSAQEIEQAKQAEAARTSPKPQPRDWMWKDRNKNPLEKKTP